MRIAVQGCAHGELDNIYSSIKELEKDDVKIDLLICCGDFQSSRNEEDLSCMAVPDKYRKICSFYKYYSGEKEAPILTIFIGGNHEASNYLQELPYGGWVAKNIYYLGYAGVIDIAGLRIGGISGIYKSHDYLKGRYEKPPYTDTTKRSVYHIRNLEIFRLKQLSKPMDIFLSHDWPAGIYNFGNVNQLLKRKSFFREEIANNLLGSKPCEELLNYLQPKYWFAAHLHCKFAALVRHENDAVTKFLALDKCLPRRQFLQIVEIPHDENRKIQISYDLEWLSILFLTNHLLCVKNVNTYMPGPGGNERYNFIPSEEEKITVLKKLGGDLKVPENFKQTATPFQPGSPKKKHIHQPAARLNPQTVQFCELLRIDDPICLVSESCGETISLESVILENTSFISDSENSDSSDNNSESTSSDNSFALCKTNAIKPARLETKFTLPKPKNANDEHDASDEIFLKTFNSELELESNLSLPDEDERQTSQEQALKKDIVISNVKNYSDSSISYGIENENTNTPQKKFKRRNADLYN